MLFLIFPFLGFIFSFFFRYLGKNLSIICIISNIGLAFISAIFQAYNIFWNNKIINYEFTWIILDDINFKYNINLDPLAIIMIILITLITFLVLLYSYEYLLNDPNLIRFLNYLIFFCLTMLLLVSAGNYLQLFLGWEGVGLSSYLLINFWHTRTEANKGALKAILINRIGDVFFMFFLALIYMIFNSFDFNIIFPIYQELMVLEIPYQITLLNFNISINTLLCICLLIAACAKSAQFLLHTWLPDAMEGPTPVSSLLHSATMVTAGVFLLLRSSFIFSVSPKISFLIAILGILTSIISGLIAMTQYDLKRIIAYSTCSQLGFMMFSLGLGYYSFVLFHLVSHAFFKCLLFLCSGSILHALNDEQDIRKMGQLLYYLPFTWIIMLIGSLSLCGFPLLSGYFSKDCLLETAYSSSNFGLFIFILAIIAAFLTSFYSFRSLYLVFFGSYFPGVKNSTQYFSDASILMKISMTILTIFSLIFGALFIEIFTSVTGLFVYKNTITFPIYASLIEYEYIQLMIKLFPTIICFLGMFLGWRIFSKERFYNIYLNYYSFFNLTNQQFFFNSFYNIIAKKALNIGYFQYKIMDRGLLEYVGPFGLTNLINWLIFKTKKLYSGYILHYILIIILILVSMIFMTNLKIILIFFLSLIIIPKTNYSYKLFKNNLQNQQNTILFPLKNKIKYIIALEKIKFFLGLSILSGFLIFKFMRNYVEKDVIFIYSYQYFIIILFSIIFYAFLIYKIYNNSQSQLGIILLNYYYSCLEIVYNLILHPLIQTKTTSIIILNQLLSKIKIHNNFIYFMGFILPRYLINFALFFDIVYFHHMYYLYKIFWIIWIPILLRIFIYIIYRWSLSFRDIIKESFDIIVNKKMEDEPLLTLIQKVPDSQLKYSHDYYVTLLVISIDGILFYTNIQNISKELWVKYFNTFLYSIMIIIWSFTMYKILFN